MVQHLLNPSPNKSLDLQIPLLLYIPHPSLYHHLPVLELSFPLRNEFFLSFGPGIILEQCEGVEKCEMDDYKKEVG